MTSILDCQWYVLSVNREEKRDNIVGLYGPFKEIDDALNVMEGSDCFLLGPKVWVFGTYSSEEDADEPGWDKLIRIFPRSKEREEVEHLGYVTRVICAPIS